MNKHEASGTIIFHVGVALFVGGCFLVSTAAGLVVLGIYFLVLGAAVYSVQDGKKDMSKVNIEERIKKGDLSRVMPDVTMGKSRKERRH